MTNLFDSRGGTITLGRSVGVGGEAEVFDIATMPGFVAKKYCKPISVLQQNKLRAMLALANPELHKIAAWPTNTLHERPNGPMCGWVMRKVAGKDIHILYSPAHRKATFPKADWKFLLFSAMNCAVAFEAVHKCSVVVGDVNQSNVLVTDQAIVTLIDCDSFQMKINGTMYPCDVGQALYTPPELQNRTLTGIQRTMNHDRFGLAVLIFHLLFMGRHPFSGRYLGKGDMPIERAIQEHRFAYGRSALSYQMSAPLHSLTLADIPSSIAALFERAFAPTSAAADSRPSAIEWYTALHGVSGSLRACGADRSHVFGTNLNKCPWCALMHGGAPNFFLPPLPGGVLVFNLTQVWTKIDQISPPSSVYAIPQPTEFFWPVAWPAALQASPPSEPSVPQILISPPAFPPLDLPPPEFEEVVVAPDDFQKSIGFAALGFTVLCPIVAVMAAVAGASGIGSAAINAMLFGGGLFLGAVLFGSWWLVLESKRRTEQEESNHDYEEELKERKTLQDKHFEACMVKLKERQAIARRKFDEATRIWQSEISPYKKEADRRREAVRVTKSHLHDAERAWSSTSSGSIAAFERKKRDLVTARARYGEIETQRLAEWQQLQARAREIQRRDFLSNVFIDNATIPQIGPTRKATLASFGIETASDIEASRLGDVPGFGEKRIATLVAWRREVEARFSFNAVTGVPQHEKQMFESKFHQLLQPLQQQLLNGHVELENIRNAADAQLAKITENIKSCMRRCCQSEADMKSVPKGV